MLYVTTAGNGAQDPNSQGGKVLRLKDDGSVPSDNPFVGRAGYRPEMYTLGHRSSLGLAMHPGTGEMWLNENGPNGGDEINILKPGANYGWPTSATGAPIRARGRTSGPATPASSRRSCTGCRRSRCRAWPSTPAIASRSGRAMSSSASLRTGEIPGTGHLERILFNEKMEELRRESLLVDLRQRIRDVRQGPDGLLYVADRHGRRRGAANRAGLVRTGW